MSTVRVLAAGFSEGFREFGHTTSTLTNTILLAMVYCLGIGITSLFARITKKQFLDLYPDPKRSSYWSDTNLGESSIDRYYQQF